MKTSTRIIAVIAALVIGLALLAGGFLVGRASLGTVGYGLGLRGPSFGFGPASRFGFGGAIPVILPILFWVTIIALGVWLIGGLFSRPTSQTPANLPPAESALDILKKRYARGEITKEQFDEMSREVAS